MPEFLASELAAWTRGQWTNGQPPPAPGFSIDTRTLQPGQVYVAVKGEHFDGHAFVEQALDRGAIAAVVEKKSPSNLPQLIVANTRQALTDMARGHRERLKSELVAVTGSVGKTTVKEMAADVLSMSAPTARTKGNFNNEIGLPLSLLGVESSDRYGVFEVGMSHPGELAPLCDLLKPSIGIVTTIGPVHLEFFSSMESIAREKAAVLKCLPPNGLAILNQDEAWFDVLKALTPCRVVTISQRQDADYTATRAAHGGFTVFEKGTGQKVDFISPLPGEYLVQDALYAIALGRQRGLAWASLVEAIKNYQPIYLRWQAQTVRGVEVINDAYNANPVSMRASLQAFSELHCSGRKWLILAGMRELGATEKAEHEALGRDLVGGDLAGLLALGPLGRLIASGAKHAGFSGKIFQCRDHAAAAAVLNELLAAGDAILLKGSRGERVEDVLKEWAKLEAKETNPA